MPSYLFICCVLQAFIFQYSSGQKISKYNLFIKSIVINQKLFECSSLLDVVMESVSLKGLKCFGDNSGPIITSTGTQAFPIQSAFDSFSITISLRTDGQEYETYFNINLKVFGQLQESGNLNCQGQTSILYYTVQKSVDGIFVAVIVEAVVIALLILVIAWLTVIRPRLRSSHRSAFSRPTLSPSERTNNHDTRSKQTSEDKSVTSMELNERNSTLQVDSIRKDQFNSISKKISNQNYAQNSIQSNELPKIGNSNLIMDILPKVPEDNTNRITYPTTSQNAMNNAVLIPDLLSYEDNF